MKRSIPLVATLRAVTTFTLLGAGVNLHAQQPGPSPTPASADVPVREVVLFSSGVGYFQHEGSVKGDATTQLRFKTGQINDILKSLVLQDLGGGRVGVVTYPSEDPLAKVLGSFQVDISGNPSLGDLLNELRGARLAISFAGVNGPENFSATALGVEKRQIPGGKDGDQPLEKEFLNVVNDRGIRSLELAKVDRFQLEDAGLQEELNRALAAVAGARDQDKKPVDIRFNGTGERRVRLGYVVEAPIWRASYRLVLAGDDPNDRKPKATLQGWAIVENQTDNDWNNVRLSLVSGRPISFTEDLYQPLYVPRPEVTPELYASLRPQTYEGGQGPADRVVITGSNIPTAAEAGTPKVEEDSGIANARRPLPRAKNLSPAPPDAPEPADTVDQAARERTGQQDVLNATSSVSSITDAAKVGELFQYTVGNVSLPRQRSAMIPIINDPIEVEKLSIFNQSVLGNHPLNGARLKNTTADAKHLLGGPVTVFDDGRYAGDAQIDNVPPGETRLLSYGIDLQVSAVVKDLQNQQNVMAGKIVKGALVLTRKAVSAKEYSFENKADHDKTLVIEHPVRAGWNLVDTPKPVETTNALYRFEEGVGAGKTEHFTVKEENVQNQTISLVSMGAGDVQFYSQNGEIPKPVRDALAKAVTLQQAVVETQRQIGEHDAQVSTLTADQARIRENLNSVDRTTSYATRLLKKLDDQESQIDKLRNETESLRTKLDGQNHDLQTYLGGLNVE